MKRRAPARAGAIGIVCLTSCSSNVDVGSARDASVIRVEGGVDGSRTDAGLALFGSKADGPTICRLPRAFHPPRR